MDVLLVALGALLIVTLLVWAYRAIARWSGVWRLLAVLVVLGVVSWRGKIVIDLRRDPTSHNIWPFEAVGVAGVALLVLGALTLARPRVRPQN